MTIKTKELIDEVKTRMITRLVAPLTLTILLAFFSGVSLITENIFVILGSIIMLIVSLYWLIRRIEK